MLRDLLALLVIGGIGFGLYFISSRDVGPRYAGDGVILIEATKSQDEDVSLLAAGASSDETAAATMHRAIRMLRAIRMHRAIRMLRAIRMHKAIRMPKENRRH